MKIFIEIIKGMLIGVANIVPGVSGGTLAIIMNVYDKLIDAVDIVYKNPIKAVKSIWMYLVGIVLGIGLSISGVTFLLEIYEIETTALFIGLIIGALPVVINEVNGKKISKADIIFFIIMMLSVIALPYLSLFGGNAVVSMNPIIMLVIGVLAAVTMVVPGVSGSMVLMAIGYYDSLAILARDSIKALITIDLPVLFTNFVILLPFGIGLVIGIIVVAKIIKWLFDKYNKTVHWAILGLIVASPFAIIMNLDLTVTNFKTAAIAIITFLIGFKVANIFSKIK